MSNDLDSLRTLVARATGTGWEAAYRQDVAALVAEVERLRQVQPKRDYYASLGAAQERSAVVAWLLRNHYDDTAERIERGEHRRGEGA